MAGLGVLRLLSLSRVIVGEAGSSLNTPGSKRSKRLGHVSRSGRFISHGGGRQPNPHLLAKEGEGQREGLAHAWAKALPIEVCRALFLAACSTFKSRSSIRHRIRRRIVSLAFFCFLPLRVSSQCLVLTLNTLCGGAVE